MGEFSIWHWLAAILVFFPAYYFLIRPFRKEADAAEDAYHRAAGIGRHFVDKNVSNE